MSYILNRYQDWIADAGHARSLSSGDLKDIRKANRWMQQNCRLLRTKAEAIEADEKRQMKLFEE